MRNLLSSFILIAGLAGAGSNAAWAQLLEPGTQSQTPNPLADSTVKPGKMILYDLEARFAKDVLARGGAGFASWFADDGVALGNGAAPLIGKVAIAKSANWSPKDYQLIWTPTDAMMGPSGDMGYTWGHFEGHCLKILARQVVTRLELYNRIRACRSRRSGAPTDRARAGHGTLLRGRDAGLDSRLVAVLDTAGRVVRLNHSCAQLTGLSLAEAVGRPFVDEVLEGDRRSWAAGKLREAANGQVSGPHETAVASRGAARAGASVGRCGRCKDPTAKFST
jgi:PAS domain-containing protein